MEIKESLLKEVKEIEALLNKEDLTLQPNFNTFMILSLLKLVRDDLVVESNKKEPSCLPDAGDH